MQYLFHFSLEMVFVCYVDNNIKAFMLHNWLGDAVFVLMLNNRKEMHLADNLLTHTNTLTVGNL